MKPSKLAAIALAALLVTAGAAAAMPAQANDAATEHGQKTEHSRSDDRAHASAVDANAERGPLADLPSQVPDHVAQIHELINQFLSGDLEGILGGQISDLARDDHAENGAANGGQAASGN